MREAIGELLGTGGKRSGSGSSAHSSRIALVGLRGAGKSTLGRMLAEDLDFPFVELSREIEKFAGCSINEIQHLYGQSAYRRYERRALEEEARRVAEALGKIGYFGPFNLDAFAWKGDDGGRRFNPRCEINARYSMGWAVGLGGAVSAGP